MELEEIVRKLVRESYGDEIKIVDITSEPGTKPGDNFGSVMVALTVTIESKTRNLSKLNFMAKRLPASEFMRDAFNVDVTFPKEIEFYQVVLPEYTKLLQENNINVDYRKSFPLFIGAEIVAKEKGIEQATLVMENVKMEGYRLRPKTEGLDLEHCNMVIKEIALFHALGVAIKIKKPDVFETKIKEAGRSIKKGQNIDMVKKEVELFFGQVIDYLKAIEEVQDLVPRVEKVMAENFLYADMVEGYKPREPFSTFVHNDLWLNNIMFKYDENDKAVSLKLVDFQRTKIGSPVSDLMLFLYVATSLDVMKNNLDELLKLYHHHFVESLTRLSVPVSAFSWENFQEELRYAEQEVSLPITMTRFLFMKVECEGSKLGMDEFGKIGGGGQEKCAVRHIQLVKDLARRGWI